MKKMREKTYLKKQSMYIVLYIIFIILSQEIVISSAFNVDLDFNYENADWIISYSFSNFRGLPNDKLTFKINITAKNKNRAVFSF